MTRYVSTSLLSTLPCLPILLATNSSTCLFHSPPNSNRWYFYKENQSILEVSVLDRLENTISSAPVRTSLLIDVALDSSASLAGPIARHLLAASVLHSFQRHRRKVHEEVLCCHTGHAQSALHAEYRLSSIKEKGQGRKEINGFLLRTKF